jgi:multidrug efflux pump subunit AcrA (membrane-fusion protein)
VSPDNPTHVLPGYEEDLDDGYLDDPEDETDGETDGEADDAALGRRSRWRSRSGLLVNGVILLALLLVAAVTVWTVRGSDGDSGNAEAQTATVSTGDVTSTVSANGNIASGRTTNADFEGSGGIVRQIYVKAGDKVRKGQVLARVDQTSARQSLRTARASLASAQASYTTTVQGQTAEERALDAQSINQAEISVSTARSQLRAAQQSLALTRQQQNAAVRRAEQDLERAQNAHEANPTTETQQSVSAARTALTLAREARASSLLQGRQNVEAQRRSLTSAQASLASTKASVAVSRQGPRSGAVEAAQAQITNAQVGVDQALTTLEQTTLRSPAAGTVAAVNGTVGEPSSATSSTSSTSSEDSTTSATSSSGFVTLTNTKILQVTADVAEADIADVEVGQSATVTLSASDEEFAGTVTAVDTVETITNNVVEYGVTVTLDNAKGIKLGQSTQVVVTTGSTQGVLRVSSSALTTIGGRTTATVRAQDGTTSTVEVVTGLEGDGFTEVLDGLAEGDVVVLPEQAASTGGFTFPGGGGLGGLG